MSSKKSTRVPKAITESVSAPGVEITPVGTYYGAELESILTDCAISGATNEKIAKKWGITRQTLWNIRRENVDAIAGIQASFFDEHKGAVMKALIESATGPKVITSAGVETVQAPNPKAIEFFFQLQTAQGASADADSLALFDRYWPYGKQAEFIFSNDSSGKLFTSFFVGGIGSGKTFALCYKALITARRNKGRTGMIVAPTYKMLQNPVLQTLIELCELMAVQFKYRKADSILELWGDTQILLRSAENPDNLRGPNLAWIGGDELRNWDSEAYRISLGRIRDPLARQRVFFGVSTPNGFDWLYDLIAGPESAKRSDNCSWVQARSVDNPSLPLDMVELARNTYDETYAEQELEGKFVNVGRGRIYYAFDRELNVGSYKLDSSLPVWIGQDFNVNPMASVIMQPKLEGGVVHVYVIGELSIKGADIDALIETLDGKGYTPKQWGDKLELYPDASGFNLSVSATKSPGEVLRKAGYNIKNPRANPLKRDRYAAVNGKLRNANKLVSLHVDRSCTNLINDLERDVYKEGAAIREDSRDGAKLRGHWADALGYAIHYHFRIESGFTPQRMS